MTAPKPKLIEVALPLAVINAEAAREKSIRHGHPSTLHLWWARRPLAAARAVIWASLVDDPSGDPTLTPEQQETERLRLFGILERLVKWENSNDADVLAAAKAEIDRCFPDGAPSILDPFGGGGAIPLEAQRLGLNALSGDLNPVAVLIQKAMLEIPPRFAGRRPVHPEIDSTLDTWERSQGMAADIEAYGQWMRDEAFKRIGHLYPDATGPNGKKLTPIAWIWTRTVESPDPTWNGHVPLVASWTLAKKSGQPKVWIEPIINRDTQTITYEVRQGGEPELDRTVNRGNGTCIATGSAMPYAYIRDESLNGRMNQELMAVVAEGSSGRDYVSPTELDRAASRSISEPVWKPTSLVGIHPRNISTPSFGLDEWWKLFTPRQLTALTTFSDLLPAVHERVTADAVRTGWANDGIRLRHGGDGAIAYADAIVTYLSFTVDKCTDYWSTISTWAEQGFVRNTFARQAIPMTWDFAEVNPFSSSTGNWNGMVGWVVKAVDHLPATGSGQVVQRDARARVVENPGVVISTDPPYYDNISYADLSDFFFVWLRRNLSDVWPEECATLATPKAQELIANRYRAGSKEKAEQHFESGMAEFMADVATAQHPSVPATIYYAYKATESKDGAFRSTGWDTFLQAVLDAGLLVTATWPMRTEKPGRMIEIGTNALASSIVLVCRPRSISAPLATRGEFIGALRAELPEAVRLLQSGNIAPVDLAQSTIGPGIGVFSRYAKVVEVDGSTMSVSDALALINDVLAEVIDGEEAELDADTRFAVSWYSQFGYNPGKSGDADGQARAKNTSLAGVTKAGIGESHGGVFRLFERSELDPGWSPVDDDRLTVWEVTQYLVAALERSESEAAGLLQLLGGFGERARALAYVLFQRATDKGWAEEAGAYNSLITAWPVLQSFQQAEPEDGQQKLI
jgi:putative DNA methylase